MDPEEPESDLRARVVAAAAALVEAGGPEAATTRAVAAAAGVQAPALYRLFGDKRGLLTAVVEDVMGRYVAQKAARPPLPDPLDDLRAGWREHVAFSLEHPGIFALLTSDPHVPTAAGAIVRGNDVLGRRIHTLARAGRLRVSERRALDLVRSMGTGVVHTLLRTPVAARDAALVDACFDAVAAAIVGDAAVAADTDGVAAAATALGARLDEEEDDVGAHTGAAVLSAGERLLLRELLTRLGEGAHRR